MILVRSAHIAVIIIVRCCLVASGDPPGAEAQSQLETPKLSFEVVSIKPQPWTNEGASGVSVRGNTLTGEHVDLYRLIEFAYGLITDGGLVSGGPGWARMGILSNVSGGESTLYQVIAKAPPGGFRCENPIAET